MKSVDFRNDPMFLRNQFARDGTFEMPVIKKTKLDLDDMSLSVMISSTRGRQIRSYISFWTTINLKSFGKTLNHALRN